MSSIVTGSANDRHHERFYRQDTENKIYWMLLVKTAYFHEYVSQDIEQFGWAVDTHWKSNQLKPTRQ